MRMCVGSSPTSGTNLSTTTMDNINAYKQAYVALKKKFKLKDIVVLFHNGKYAISPCLTVIDQNDNKQNIYVDDKYHNVDFAYIDEFHGRYGRVPPWMVAKAMFDLAKWFSIYMISSKSMEDIDCNIYKKEYFTILRKGLQLEQFLITEELAS